MCFSSQTPSPMGTLEKNGSARASPAPERKDGGGQEHDICVVCVCVRMCVCALHAFFRDGIPHGFTGIGSLILYKF